MFINDPLLYHINQTLLDDKDIVRDNIWKDMNAKYQNNKHRPLYVNPSQNIATQIIKQYDILTQGIKP
jgi:hypothetical protein